ncbi:MAG: DUF86 domain-containing protein [Clostridiales bacterium]|nr:DUF86 domain-containing protein [Clostridiales bacterium]
MHNEKNDQYYIVKIKADLLFIVKHMEKVDIQSLKENEVLQDSMLFRMIQISENAKKLSEDYRRRKDNVPWQAIFGLRNRIVHDYGSVDLRVLFDTLIDDIPVLLEQINE